MADMACKQKQQHDISMDVVVSRRMCALLSALLLPVHTKMDDELKIRILLTQHEAAKHNSRAPA
jgi:hypothetical protein